MNSLEVRDRLWNLSSFCEEFKSANEGKERRDVILNYIEALFGSEARVNSSIAERIELETYFTHLLTDPNETQLTEDFTVSPTNKSLTVPAFEVKTFIFGQDAKNVSDDQIFAHVANLEAKIESLRVDIKKLNNFVVDRDRDI